MAYREGTYRDVCAMCGEAATQRCAMCTVYICATHGYEDACVNCAADEYVAEAKAEKRSLGWVIGGTLIAVPLGMMLAPISPIAGMGGVIAGYVLPLLAPGVIHILRRRRRKGRRKLPSGELDAAKQLTSGEPH